VLENDANAAAAGEAWTGAGADEAVKTMVMITLGTGVGAGIIVDGRMLHGGWDMAGEIGHTIVEFNGRQCGCGSKGCLEAYCSATGVRERARDALRLPEHANSSLKSVPDADLSCKHVYDDAAAGDALAVSLCDETHQRLAMACVNVCRTVDAQLVCFAGGVINAGAPLFDGVNAYMKQMAWRMPHSVGVRVVPAQLGDDAGVVGAAAVAQMATGPAFGL
jgi:glucokinase